MKIEVSEIKTENPVELKIQLNSKKEIDTFLMWLQTIPFPHNVDVNLRSIKQALMDIKK